MPTKKTQGKWPLVDYNQLHVVTFNEYLKIMWQITMDKETTKMIRKDKRKEREEKRARQVVLTLKVIDLGA